MARMFGRPEEKEQLPTPEMQMEMLNRPATAQVIGEKEIHEAQSILQKYKAGKEPLEKRIIEDELWWELRHWEVLRQEKNKSNPQPEPSSAWLFNAIANKHADAMDNAPEPMALPREESDRESAKVLSSVLPVTMEYNGFEETYSTNWWEKLKHGTAVYGTFWDPEKENGLGDTDIHGIDLLRIFWEPGITDIQASRNLFIVDLVDEDVLDAQYPEHKGKMKGGPIEVAKYNYDDTVDTDNKTVVVDWYYRRKTAGGKVVTHFVKFVGNVLLYASENDPNYAQTGWYEHGQYPVDFDVLFPEKGTPCGFGYVAICRDPQMYIDKLSANIMENAMMGTKKRFFASTSLNVNKEQFLNWNEPMVEVEGEVTDARLKEIVTRPLDGIYFNVMQQKIEEMKDTASNRDVNSGGSASGVTAAAAIAALQEAGNKVSRDMISASYRCYVRMCSKLVELMRQFYTEARTFRILAPDASDYSFVQFSNSAIREQQTGVDSEGNPTYRRPVFDIKIKAQKKNPFSRMEQNERAKELYGMGFFAPDNAQAAMGALQMMDFEGIEQVRNYVQQGQTLLSLVQQMSQQLAMLTGIGAGGEMGGGMPTAQAAPSEGGGNAVADGIMQAQTPMTGYGQSLAKRSAPSMEG